MYATWIKDGYEQLGHKSCRSQESCQDESQLPYLEPRSCEIKVCQQVFHSILLNLYLNMFEET